MRIWVMMVSEPLPTDDFGDRLMRIGMLVNRLLAEGHEVVWWSSSFHHDRKHMRFREDTSIDVTDHFRIWCLYGRPYRQHVSFRRLLSHMDIARGFRRHREAEPRPDLILCCLPLIELAEAAASYGQAKGIPVVLDARDMWPDIFVEVVPRWLHGLARLVLFPLERKARKAFAEATAITGITPAFVGWGLGKANRRKTDLDRDFPLAYQDEPLSTDALDEAMERWHERGLQHGAFVACFFGAINRRFDLETLIKSARMLAQGTRRIQFVLCGDGDWLEHYRRLAAGCENIVFPGWLARADISALMRMSNVGLAPYFSSPSFRVSYPNKSIEYLAGGLPVVSSLRGMLEDLLGEHGCGVTYDNGDAQRLTELLSELYDDPSRVAAMSERARALFERRFAAEMVYGDMMQHLVRVYDAYHRA